MEEPRNPHSRIILNLQRASRSTSRKKERKKMKTLPLNYFYKGRKVGD